MVPSPSEYHQRISTELEDALMTFVKKKKSGLVYYAPFDVVFSEKQTIEVLSNDVAGYKKTGTYDINTPLSAPLLPDPVDRFELRVL